MPELKAWQLGRELDFLQRIEDKFEDYNQWSRSPFSEVNKPKIAKWLADDNLIDVLDLTVAFSSVKSMTPIKAYLDVVIAYKRPGDLVIEAFTYEHRQQMIDWLRSLHLSVYCWIWQESAEMRSIVDEAGFTFVGSKISSFAEIRGLYFREGVGEHSLFDDMQRVNPVLDPTEFMGLQQADIWPSEEQLNAAIAEIDALARDFTNHYSSYNKAKSWSALSLRGYTPDPGFITKPSEMRAKWHEENPGPFEMQDTLLRAQLPAVDALHKRLTDRATSVHRIRLMQLTPGGGELQRHTDLTDKDSGIADGCVARFHFPLITNPDVIFGSWDMRGNKREINMRVGECWYLDTRKPHTAVNNGTTERIHLVVDVESNAKIRGLLCGD